MTAPEVRVERTLAAPPERVYAAWTEPAILGRWYCPNPDLPLAVEADARVGGRYRVDMGGGRFVEAGAASAMDGEPVMFHAARRRESGGTRTAGRGRRVRVEGEERRGPEPPPLTEV